MIDLQNEKPISLREVAKLPMLRRDGKSPSLGAVYRWVTNGVRGVRLEVVRLPMGLASSVEAVERFVERLTDPDAGENTRSTTQREREAARAIAELDAAGI